MSDLDISAIKARLAKVTPGPWIDGDHWWIAGVNNSNGPGTCAYCKGNDPIVWEGRRDINGTKMLAHVHQAKKPWHGKGHHLYSYNGGPEPILVVGPYDYETGGVASPRDADFIAHSPEDVAALIAEVERLRAQVASESL